MKVTQTELCWNYCSGQGRGTVDLSLLTRGAKRYAPITMLLELGLEIGVETETCCALWNGAFHLERRYSFNFLSSFTTS